MSVFCLPGKALKMLVDIERLAERFNMGSQASLPMSTSILKALPGKLDKTPTWYSISLPIVSLFKLAIMR